MQHQQTKLRNCPFFLLSLSPKKKNQLKNILGYLKYNSAHISALVSFYVSMLNDISIAFFVPYFSIWQPLCVLSNIEPCSPSVSQGKNCRATICIIANSISLLKLQQEILHFGFTFSLLTGMSSSRNDLQLCHFYCTAPSVLCLDLTYSTFPW